MTHGQQEGIFVAPSVLVGFNYIAEIYHPIAEHAPANRGFNTAFQYGGIAGYKWKKVGVEVEFKAANYRQNFNQNNDVGNLQLQYFGYGCHFLYQLGPINNTKYFHTLKLGGLINTPRSAQYIAKNEVTGEVYANENQNDLAQTNAMISAAYGITTGYKLLWADFSIRAAYSLNNIYKPLTGINGKNFVIGFQLAFGLFSKIKH